MKRSGIWGFCQQFAVRPHRAHSARYMNSFGMLLQRDLPIGEYFCRRHDSGQGQSLVRLRQLNNHLRKVLPDCWEPDMEMGPQLQIIGHYSFDADPLRLQIQPKTPIGNHDGIFRREAHFSQSPRPATQVATFLQRPRLSQKSCSKKWRASLENVLGLFSDVQLCAESAKASPSIGCLRLERGWWLTERQSYPCFIHSPDDAFIEQDGPWPEAQSHLPRRQPQAIPHPRSR